MNLYLITTDYNNRSFYITAQNFAIAEVKALKELTDTFQIITIIKLIQKDIL